MPGESEPLRLRAAHRRFPAAEAGGADFGEAPPPGPASPARKSVGLRSRFGAPGAAMTLDLGDRSSQFGRVGDSPRVVRVFRLIVTRGQRATMHIRALTSWPR